jgi:hypothetical protein
VRFEVHRSPVGHEWRIQLGHRIAMFFHTHMVANDSGSFAVDRRYGPAGPSRLNWYWARAVDTQTGQRCESNPSLDAPPF